MGQNFIDCDREQAFLVPPSLRDWLPEHHVAWFVIEAVGRLDLRPFYTAYPADGHGHAAYELNLCAYALMRPLCGDFALEDRPRMPEPPEIGSGIGRSLFTVRARHESS